MSRRKGGAWERYEVNLRRWSPHRRIALVALTVFFRRLLRFFNQLASLFARHTFRFGDRFFRFADRAVNIARTTQFTPGISLLFLLLSEKFLLLRLKIFDDLLHLGGVRPLGVRRSRRPLRLSLRRSRCQVRQAKDKGESD